MKRKNSDFDQFIDDHHHDYFFEDDDHHDHEHEHEHDHEHDDDIHCVCKVVRKIHKAQLAAEERRNDCCKVSCERSIQQLLSPKKFAPVANTIPFSLECGCKSCNNSPFLGKAPLYGKNGKFCLIFSPFFKVKKIKDDCCAVLELLWPTCNGEPFAGKFTGDHKKSFPCFDFNGFIETGACITVDLECFCGISCHQPTMTENATASQIHDILKAHKCTSK
ncbi:CotY/CotZ family spore coat protein [Calidifontibacillus oryziterrae]|uniref:CotY/CotZ family spore coat protein n=1 Tax=Calidifontibacillus oryziterrae TaxID=1191699 RepID=UPI00030D564D|nr:CotY/CotZ family spore coat protein [Calidifontibacillus oryziterrae]